MSLQSEVQFLRLKSFRWSRCDGIFTFYCRLYDFGGWTRHPCITGNILHRSYLSYMPDGRKPFLMVQVRNVADNGLSNLFLFVGGSALITMRGLIETDEILSLTHFLICLRRRLTKSF